MYQIGLFSKMNQVTVKTLHHYDEIGLLKPAYVDKNSGYRYYTTDQTYTLHRINALKQLDFGLDEIAKIVNGTSKNQYLQKKKGELLAEIAEKTNKLSQIEFYLSEQPSTQAPYEVLIKELPEVIVASKRTILDSYDDLFKIMPPMGKAMEKLGCECAVPAYCFNIYHDGEYKESNIDAEICEAVTQKKKDALGITFKMIPKVQKAACVLHKGPYENFPKAYLALTLWMESNEYKPADSPRESYIDGLWNKENEADWLTEIQFPIEKI